MGECEKIVDKDREDPGCRNAAYGEYLCKDGKKRKLCGIHGKTEELLCDFGRYPKGELKELEKAIKAYRYFYRNIVGEKREYSYLDYNIETHAHKKAMLRMSKYLAKRS